VCWRPRFISGGLEILLGALGGTDRDLHGVDGGRSVGDSRWQVRCGRQRGLIVAILAKPNLGSIGI
jgi:hypothetical protein